MQQILNISKDARFINDARGSRLKVNARFAAGYILNKCSVTGYFWVRIYATKTIKPGDEIFVEYGEDFWAEAQFEALSDPASTSKIGDQPPRPHHSYGRPPRQSRTSLANLTALNQQTSTTTRPQQHPQPL